MVPCRRLCYTAAWIRALLAEDESCPLRLERFVAASPPRPCSMSGWVIEFDASIYGGGALLRDGDGRVMEYFAVVWYGDEAPHLKVVPNDTCFQSFWKLSTLLALCTWGDRFVHEKVAVLGDTTAALSSALALKGRGPMLAVARELSWRQARRKWAFDVAHLPSEYNVVADALSRTADPKGCAWPARAVATDLHGSAEVAGVMVSTT